MPFKAGRRHEWELLQDEMDSADEGITLGIDGMFQAAEQELFQMQPWIYWEGFGLEVTFGQLEQQMLRTKWYVTEENIGFPGWVMTLPMGTNAFVLLSKDLKSDT